MKIEKETFKQAKELARQWQSDIEKNRQSAEKKFHKVMQRMLENPKNKIFLIELLDQSFRSLDNKRIADQLEYIFDKYNNTTFFTEFEQLLVWLFRSAGIHFPFVSVPLFIGYLRNDIKDIVIKGEESTLNSHLSKRINEDTRVNINIIGEAVLGKKEALDRVEKYIQILENPNIDYVSIKISTIFSQINPIAHKWNVNQISLELEKIYTAAIQNDSKFINLDMEEYRDIDLTVDVFIQTLSQDKFKNLHAGIVLQAYIPEALRYVKKLYDWAKSRVDNGGAPIKVRLVKGANQEMEQTEASLRGWPCVTYLQKSQSDANFKVLMDFLLDKDVSPYVHVGIASHNLFDQALAFLVAKQRNVLQYFSAEMLEGMSETAYRTLKNENINVILYAPTATGDTFTNAIAYLVRRFDENTAEQNYLKHSFGLQVPSEAWDVLVKSYDDSIETLATLEMSPFRNQNRNIEIRKEDIDVQNYVFTNESDTDFILKENQIWVQNICDKWKNISKKEPLKAYPVIGGKQVTSDVLKEVIDKSQYHENIIVGQCSMAVAKDLLTAVDVAKNDSDNWSLLSLSERTRILMNVAHEFRKNRADLIGVAAAELGKVFSETDVEVSEAIDFLNFYPYSVKKLADLDGIIIKEKGVGLVISPWNFPIAIATGGIAAALATGNRVILKPSSDAVLSAFLLCKCFWDAGVSTNTLQFTPTEGALAGEHLVKNRDVDFVIFTGSEKTAFGMLENRPDLRLNAETGGKDATIVSALADRDQAVKNVIASAFNNSGQKCSATSLLVLEKEIYEDEKFKSMLMDASESLYVGSVWNAENKIGALVNIPSANLKRSLEYLDDCEEWLIKPSFADNENPYMLKPCIRWGTKVGDFCHMNELFGPVLSVMCADDLDDAIDIVNATGYGLTAGLESLDEREKDMFKQNLKAGNLYLNRMTTGAIVTRQPFGGMGKSAIGSGIKAGGFNYVSQFLDISCDGSSLGESARHNYIQRVEEILNGEVIYKDILNDAVKTMENFAYWLEKEFNKEHDYTNIRGESNIIRYLNIEKIAFSIEEDNSLYEIICSIAAAKMSGSILHVSLPIKVTSPYLLWLIDKKDFLLSSEDTFVQEDKEDRLQAMRDSDRVRYLKKKNIQMDIYETLSHSEVYIESEPFVAQGRIELMHYFREQSISDSYHRYGNLGLKALSPKTD